MKVCNKCGEEKVRECFSKNKTRKDGLANWCKVCSGQYIKGYQQDTH